MSGRELSRSGDLGIREGLIFLDMMTNMEKIGDYCWNVSESLHHGDGAAQN